MISIIEKKSHIVILSILVRSGNRSEFPSLLSKKKLCLYLNLDALSNTCKIYCFIPIYKVWGTKESPWLPVRLFTFIVTAILPKPPTERLWSYADEGKLLLSEYFNLTGFTCWNTESAYLNNDWCLFFLFKPLKKSQWIFISSLDIMCIMEFNYLQGTLKGDIINLKGFTFNSFWSGIVLYVTLVKEFLLLSGCTVANHLINCIHISKCLHRHNTMPNLKDVNIWLIESVPGVCWKGVKFKTPTN